MVERDTYVAPQRDLPWAKVAVENYSQFSRTEILVMLTLHSHECNGFAFPSPQLIAKRTNVALNIVYATLKKLTLNDVITAHTDSEGRSGWLLDSQKVVPISTKSRSIGQDLRPASDQEIRVVKSRNLTSLHYRTEKLIDHDNNAQTGTLENEGDVGLKVGPITRGKGYPSNTPVVGYPRPHRFAPTALPLASPGSDEGRRCAALVLELTGNSVTSRYWDELVEQYGGIDEALAVIRAAHEFTPSILTAKYPKLTPTAVKRWADNHYVIAAPVDRRALVTRCITDARRHDGTINEGALRVGFRLHSVRREDVEHLLVDDTDDSHAIARVLAQG